MDSPIEWLIHNDDSGRPVTPLLADLASFGPINDSRKGSSEVTVSYVLLELSCIDFLFESAETELLYNVSFSVHFALEPLALPNFILLNVKYFMTWTLTIYSFCSRWLH